MENGLRVQGDVFLVRVLRIPDLAKPVQRNSRGFVLAEGEATGHAHCITDQECEMYESEGVLYLRTAKAVEVKHEEHKQITIDTGIWKIGIVREYDAFAEEARNVRD